MWLFGSPDAISGFPGRSDNDLTKFDGSWNDYIKTYLYFLFLYQQYGGRVGTSLVRNIVASPLPSIEGIDSGFAATGLPERFDDVLDHWALQNRINDSLVLGGRYAYYDERVPSFGNAKFHLTYPVNVNENLDRWAGEYILFRRGLNLELTFDGADAADFRAYAVAVDTLRHRVAIDTIPLDSLQRGSITIPGFDTAYQTVYLVPVSHTPAGRMAYNYTASATGVAEPALPVARVSPAGVTFINASAGVALRPGSKLFSSDGRQVQPPGLRTGVYSIVEAGGTPVQRVVVIRD
jgi:hypothetical protein